VVYFKQFSAHCQVALGILAPAHQRIQIGEMDSPVTWFGFNGCDAQVVGWIGEGGENGPDSGVAAPHDKCGHDQAE